MPTRMRATDGTVAASRSTKPAISGSISVSRSPASTVQVKMSAGEGTLLPAEAI